MKVYAINGSPRKNENTATLLKKALEGVNASAPNEEIETEIINLYDLNYTGCKSCFACKRIGSKSYGKCAIRDDLHDVLEKLADADGIIFGSPIYFSSVTAALQGFFERFIFQYFLYDKNYTGLAPKKMPTAFIYTMNATKEFVESNNYLSQINGFEPIVGMIFKQPLVMHSYNTYQFDDYSKYETSAFSEEEKRKQREIQFPLDCEEAFNLGKNLLK